MRKLFIVISLLLLTFNVYASYYSSARSSGYRSYSGSRSYGSSYGYRPTPSYRSSSSSSVNRTTIINNHSGGYSSGGGFMSSMMGAWIGSSLANNNNSAPVVINQAQPIPISQIQTPQQMIVQPSEDGYYVFGFFKFLLLCGILIGIYYLMKKLLINK